MQIINQRTELVPIDSIAPDPVNPNQGDIGAISESIESSGFFGHVLVQQSTGRIIAGAHRHAAARALGASEIPVTFVDVDDERARRIMLADNRTARLGADDPEKLAALLQELAGTPDELSGTGYDGDALDELLADLGARQPEMRGDPDAVPEVPEDQEPVTKRGDIIRLGRHTLGCIDSTSLDEVRCLLGGVTLTAIVTDPPYGVAIVKDAMVGATFAESVASKGCYDPIIGDETNDTAIAAYRLCSALGSPSLIFWGANYYASALPDSRCWLVWDKRDDSGIHNTFADAELAWTNLSGPTRVHRQLWNGMIREGEHEKRLHPTQKPVALFEWCLGLCTHAGDTVADFFLGSGTALVACERSGRTLYGADLSPRYVDLAARRFQEMTGIVPVLASTGEPRDFMAARSAGVEGHAQQASVA